MNMETIVDARGAAKKLGITVASVHRLCARGTLGSMWIGGARVFKIADLDRYLSDEEAQKRRRNGSLITQGKLELNLDEAVYRVQSIGSKRDINL